MSSFGKRSKFKSKEECASDWEESHGVKEKKQLSETNMENRDRLLKLDPLRLVVVRKSLKTVAECLSNLDSAEANGYLDTLIDELKLLRHRDTSSMAWSQVTANIQDGPCSYGLETIGLWPEGK